MLDPILRSMFVAVVIALLRALFLFLNVPVSDEFLMSLAIAIIGWILGNSAGSATAQAIHYKATPMLDPILRSMFVAVVIALLRALFLFLNVPVSDEFLMSLAIAIIGWILGNPAGSATAQAIHIYRARFRK